MSISSLMEAFLAFDNWRDEGTTMLQSFSPLCWKKRRVTASFPHICPIASRCEWCAPTHSICPLGRECEVACRLVPNLSKLLQLGLEPRTLGLLDPRSNQLSYKSSVVTSAVTYATCVRAARMYTERSWTSAVQIIFDETAYELHKRLSCIPKPEYQDVCSRTDSFIISCISHDSVLNTISYFFLGSWIPQDSLLGSGIVGTIKLWISKKFGETTFNIITGCWSSKNSAGGYQAVFAALHSGAGVVKRRR